MNSIYLMLDEKKDVALFKVGFASNLFRRMPQYSTHNARAQCIDYVKTQIKSKRQVEKKFHMEIKARGYSFCKSPITGSYTEWFEVPYNDPFYAALKSKGLNAFRCGKYRKSYGAFKVEG